VPEEEWVRIPCPVIVTKAQWDQCQQRIKKTREKFSTRITNRQLLTGLLRCPKCKRVMTGRGHAGTMPSHYKCKESAPSTNTAGIACWKKNINIKLIDPLVLDMVLLLSRNARVVELAYTAYQNTLTSGFTEDEYCSLKRDLTQMNKEMMNTAKAQIQGVAAGVDTAIYESILRDLSLKKTQIEARLDSIDRAREAALETNDKATGIETALGSAAEVLTSDLVPRHTKNAILHKVIHHIYPSIDGSQFTTAFASFYGATRLVVTVATGQLLTFEVVAVVD